METSIYLISEPSAAVFFYDDILISGVVLAVGPLSFSLTCAPIAVVFFAIGQHQLSNPIKLKK